MPPPGRCKLLKCRPQEQELCVPVGCIILNGESRYLRSSRLWMMVANKLFLGGPKLRQYVPLQPSHRRYAPSLPPEDPTQLQTAQLTASQFFCYFRPKSFSLIPRLPQASLKPSSNATSNVLQHSSTSLQLSNEASSTRRRASLGENIL